MRLEHPAHPGRSVRLAYCMNLVPAEDLLGVGDGIERLGIPLARRFGHGGAGEGGGFGIGLWIPLDAALPLAHAAGAPERRRFAELLVEHGLDAFTFNAFPTGRFHAPGLKERVFSPSWASAERLAFTLAVAEIAVACADARDEPRGRDAGHLSISTHCGAFAASLQPGDLDRCAEGFALCLLRLAKLEEESGRRVVLALEPEPRSSANDTRELAAFVERVRVRAREVLGRGLPGMVGPSEELVDRYLGTCLDTCHAAVEFEEPAEALHRATASGTPLGKLQFTSALELVRPGADADARARLLALDEPVYLHQVTGRREGELLRAGDLPELARAVSAGDPAWLGCDAWRCHFHVPVDWGTLHEGDEGGEGEESGHLATTRAFSEAALAAALAAPERWGSRDLHVEVETYTWSVLPGPRLSDERLVDGLERELRHVLGRLERAGWRPAGASTGAPSGTRRAPSGKPPGPR